MNTNTTPTDERRFDPNRQVHARNGNGPNDGMEVVRYDRTSKWYLEPVNRDLTRQKVTIDEAVNYAANFCSDVYFGLPGGSTFDRKVQALSA